MIKYVHIGYPKNLSTTLQRDFFSRHPKIYHMGIGIGTNVGYIDAEIGSACENDLIYSRDYAYNLRKESIQDSFKKHFTACEKSVLHKACGISLEHISFSFTPDNIDITAKAKRLLDIFGNDTKIIMVIREQGALLKSLYREAIRMGYSGSFSDFMEYTYLCQDRNFATEFLYSNTANLFSEYFGKHNVVIIPIEEARNPDGSLKETDGRKIIISELCSTLGLEYFDENFGHHNKSLTDSQLLEKIELNKVNAHDLGNGLYGRSANFHRLKDYFNVGLNFPVPEDILYFDARVKNKNIEEAIKRSGSSNNAIDYSYSPEIKLRLQEMYNKSNRELEDFLGRKLPTAYDYFRA